MTKKIEQIIVNAQTVEWDKEKISFEEVVKIAFPNVNENQMAIYIVTYSEWPKQNPKWHISLGEKVHVENNMEFTCTSTSQS